eukprot:CAMPEP_0178401336 /NCGR_PEP_ID=MMETSP0689_2-20121128/16250_1 /TAXON_ID=160604 /ORGANISM="Amphidinium massartii, Strain CS-259" /LENGTH=193 /DNA_ID=CAMNT_0020022155 /DNA_START=87 /DNA_END=667 /DNA_ORIENTATION=-
MVFNVKSSTKLAFSSTKGNLPLSATLLSLESFVPDRGPASSRGFLGIPGERNSRRSNNAVQMPQTEDLELEGFPDLVVLWVILGCAICTITTFNYNVVEDLADVRRLKMLLTSRILHLQCLREAKAGMSTFSARIQTPQDGIAVLFVVTFVPGTEQVSSRSYVLVVGGSSSVLFVPHETIIKVFGVDLESPRL